MLIKPIIFDRVTKEEAIEDGSMNAPNQKTLVFESGDSNNNGYLNSPTNGPVVENCFGKG